MTWSYSKQPSNGLSIGGRIGVVGEYFLKAQKCPTLGMCFLGKDTSLWNTEFTSQMQRLHLPPI